MSRPALCIEYPLSPEQCSEAGRLTTAATARAWVDDLLRPHGLETLDPGLGGPDDADALAWGTIPHPKGWTLVVQPVAECTSDTVGDGPFVTLPDGTRIEELGWEVDGDAWNRSAPQGADVDDGLTVGGDELPSIARALVTAWWDEHRAAGTVPRPPAPDADLARGDSVRYDDGLEYADTLERTARDLRAVIARARAEDATRRGDYTAALRALADRMTGEAAAATDLAADIIGSGQGRLTPGREAGPLGTVAWVLTTRPTE